MLVRHVRLGRWRASLGFPIVTTNAPPPTGRLAEAQGLARTVERAATRLPGDSKCLPRAMALQWMLRRRAIPSRLVIAVAAKSASDPHHAWTECDGAMLVGACDRDAYRPLLVLAQGEVPPASDRD